MLYRADMLNPLTPVRALVGGVVTTVAAGDLRRLALVTWQDNWGWFAHP